MNVDFIVNLEIENYFEWFYLCIEWAGCMGELAPRLERYWSFAFWLGLGLIWWSRLILGIFRLCCQCCFWMDGPVRGKWCKLFVRLVVKSQRLVPPFVLTILPELWICIFLSDSRTNMILICSDLHVAIAYIASISILAYLFFLDVIPLKNSTV